MQWSGHKVIGLPLVTVGTQEWRGHPYALDLRGRREKFGTPHFNIRMLHAKGVCIANA